MKALREAPSWLISAAIHLALLLIFAMITWVVILPGRVDRTIAIAESEQIVSDEGPGEQGLSGSKAGAENNPRTDAPDPAAAIASTRPKAQALRQAVQLQTQHDLGITPVAAQPEATASLMDSLTGLSGDQGQLGTGLFPGPGAGFGKMLGGLRKTGLDVVLVLDATGSMAPYINQGKKRLREIVKVIRYLVPDSRFGLVAYKDYGDDYGENAVKSLKIAEDIEPLQKMLDETVAAGGGDEPEPIHQALNVATDVSKIGWRGGRKWVIILVGDSSIHVSGKAAAFDLAKKFAVRKGTINVIDVGGAAGQDQMRQNVQPDLARIARDGGGQSFLLTDRDAFWRHLIVSVFGREYENDVNTIVQKVLGKE